uniref:ATP synthase F0 subunit 8 n=1 Tax=Desmaulus extinctorium TaxID=211681 RepID=UPI002551CBB8|nr:ATP synthase F0 subunit 8 [Desmaulus extinctorium]WGH72831.1 ATP synthase F0 subunit 8 [Desmaulus extinctorium]
MPQLSPLNWIFLYLLFWFIVMTVSVMIWWSNNSFFRSGHLNLNDLNKNNWLW